MLRIKAWGREVIWLKIKVDKKSCIGQSKVLESNHKIVYNMPPTYKVGLAGVGRNSACGVFRNFMKCDSANFGPADRDVSRLSIDRMSS